MDTCRQQPGSQAREINFLWSRVAQGVMPRQMMADHFPDLDDFRFAERDIARRAITPEIDTKPSLGQFLAWLIRPAGCTLGGTVNVSSLFGPPLPERPGQQRNHLTRLVRSCKGRDDARFSRCQNYGADPARIPNYQIRHHQPQRESGTGFPDVRPRRLEYAVGHAPVHATGHNNSSRKTSWGNDQLPGHPVAGLRSLPFRELRDLRGSWWLQRVLSPRPPIHGLPDV